MASVTSLDKDMRKLRMDRYTPQAEKETRTFIEDTLGERLPGADLLVDLKDGVALCKYDTCGDICKPNLANLYIDSSISLYLAPYGSKQKQ